MTAVPLYATPHSPGRKNLAAVATKIAQLLKIDLQPWQIDAISLLTEMDENQHFVYRDSSLLVGRQNGKSTLALVLLLIRALASPDTRCIFGAQTLKDSRAMLLETWVPLLEASPIAGTFSVRSANGSERILFKNGSSIQLLTTTSLSAGHGQVVDFAILDEAFSQPDARVETAMFPAMITRSDHGGGPQFLVISNAGTLDGKSPYLWDRVERGRHLAQAGTTTGNAYIEYSAPDDADPADPATWALCNPALGYTISEHAIRTEFESMQLAEFQRSRLCQWTLTKNDPVISLDRWAQLEDRSSAIIGPMVFALDASPSRDHSSISAAGKRADGHLHVEVIDSRPGTGWLVQRLRELVKKNSPVGIYVDAQTASLVPEIEASGVYVTPIQAAEHAASFAFFLEAVADGTVHHRRDDELVHSLTAATTRPLGDGGNAFSRKGSATSIDNLVSVTLALWAAQSRLSGEVNIYNLNSVIRDMQRRQDEDAGLTPEEAERRRAVRAPDRLMPGEFTLIGGEAVAGQTEPGNHYYDYLEPDETSFPMAPPELQYADTATVSDGPDIG